LEAITGVHRTWDDFEKVGERIWNLTRMYWTRENEGFGRAWDMPSPRFYEDAPLSGATKGQITKLEDVHRLLDMYYKQRGWSHEGLPTIDKLSELNLQELVT
jgi:aldehyde:ferredoxin oxidoreductase